MAGIELLTAKLGARLFLEECRAISVAIATWRASDPRTYHQEVFWVFLRLRGHQVTVPGPRYFVEVKYGYPQVVRHLEQNLTATPGGRDAARVVLVINSAASRLAGDRAGDSPKSARA